ncbi:MAG: SDR family NAD(P)-dependent oxidoreductase [Gemmatimonadales bacterium]
MELARHRFLVTGGTRGIGLELCRALAGRGAKVAVVGRDPTGLAEVEKALPGVVALQADLARVDGLPGLGRAGPRGLRSAHGAGQ